MGAVLAPKSFDIIHGFCLLFDYIDELFHHDNAATLFDCCLFTN